MSGSLRKRRPASFGQRLKSGPQLRRRMGAVSCHQRLLFCAVWAGRPGPAGCAGVTLFLFGEVEVSKLKVNHEYPQAGRVRWG
jgi:hypothetical protein